MTAIKVVRAILVAFTAFLLAAGAAAPAMAQEEPAKAVSQSGNEMGAQARWFNEVASWQILYQCPKLGCNEGAVYPGQHLGEICHIDINGYQWALVYNRVNEHTGFINRNNLIHKRSLAHCSTIGRGETAAKDFPLFQCPAEHCNQAIVLRNHLFRMECYIPKSQDWYWIWAYNRTNTHEGFFVAPVTYGLEACRV